MQTLRGKVVKGESRGKSLGFPTANIRLHKKIPEGIYLSVVKFDKKEHPSITFIGNPKTFDSDSYKAEVYILNFGQNLYGKWLSVKLIKKIRDNKKFDTVEELVNQMQLDKKQAEEYFKKSKLRENMRY